MSLRLMKWAWETDFPQTEKMVLLCLCDFANDSGSCWPSIDRLATKCSTTDRTVQRTLKRLVERGVLTVETGGGKGHSNRYSINPDISSPLAAKGDIDDTKGDIDDTNPDTVSPEPSENHQEPSIVSNDTARAQDEAPAVLEIWRDMAKPLKLSCWNTLTDKRRKVVRARLRDYGLEAIRKAIEHVPKSAFLRGDRGNWGGANLDFLMRQDSVAKILEGQYDDRPEKSRPQAGDDRRDGVARALDRRLGLGQPAGPTDRRDDGGVAESGGYPAARIASMR